MVMSSDVVVRVAAGSTPGMSAALGRFFSLGGWCPQATASESASGIVQRLMARGYLIPRDRAELYRDGYGWIWAAHPAPRWAAHLRAQAE
jgi:hypothetical protein